MYRLNKTNRNVLITPDEVIFHAPTTGEEGERQILNNIIVAEERWISEALGFDFYEHLINSKNRRVNAENKSELLEKIKVSYAEMGIEFSDEILKNGMIVNSIDFITDEWVKKLWNQYLWKITAECVDLMAIIPSWLKTSASGQQMQNPKTIGSMDQKSASGERADVKMKMDNALLERIEPMLKRMHEWLCKHKAHFPLYTKSCDDCECCRDEKSNNVTPNAGFAFGHYDD